MAFTDWLLLFQVASASFLVFDFWEEKSLQLGEIIRFFSPIFVAVGIREKQFRVRSELCHFFVIFTGGT